jgi:hypothetical protein
MPSPSARSKVSIGIISFAEITRSRRLIGASFVIGASDSSIELKTFAEMIRNTVEETKGEMV